MDHAHFSNLSVLLPQGGTTWNLSNTGPAAPEEKSFEILNNQTWPCRKKVKCQCTTIILAILVEIPSPMIYTKILPQGILVSGEEDF